VRQKEQVESKKGPSGGNNEGKPPRVENANSEGARETGRGGSGKNW